MQKIIIFGVGAVANMIIPRLKNVEILGFVNPYTFKKGEFMGRAVFGLDEILELDFDFCLLACGNVSAVKNKLNALNIDKSKIKAFICDDSDEFLLALNRDINAHLREFFNDCNLDFIIENYNPAKLFISGTWHSGDEFLDSTSDFVRTKFLSLLAQNKISGAVAECGVYKGDFARYINYFFKDRDFYLFDTFEGFSATSIEAERALENELGGTCAADSNRFQQIPTDSNRFQQIPTDSNRFQQIPTDSNRFQQIPTDSNRFQQIPTDSNRFQQIPSQQPRDNLNKIAFAPNQIKNNDNLFQVRFSDTSKEGVLAKMPFPNKCIIKQGFFPQSFDLEDSIKFAFVSLDMDLYQPILDGLEVFYPRLNKGGVILIHDYGNAAYRLCKKAVDDFAKKYGLFIIPLCDFYQSAIILKA